MNIELKFDYHSRIIYVPDGYVSNLADMQLHFFEWLYNQPDCFVQCKNGNLAISYNEETVLNYINNVVLHDSKEKAYCISNVNTIKGNIYTLNF